jgi:hypothetical protein
MSLGDFVFVAAMQGEKAGGRRAEAGSRKFSPENYV